MICPKCGKETGESNFCPECGTPINQINEINNDEKAIVPSGDSSEKTDDNTKASDDGNTDKNGETYYDALRRIEDEKNAAKKKKKKKIRIGCSSFIIIIIVLVVISTVVSNHKRKKEENNTEITSSMEAESKTESTVDVTTEAKKLEDRIDEIDGLKFSPITWYSIKNVRKDYENASEQVKAAVKNKEKLVEVEKRYNQYIEKEGKVAESILNTEYDKVEKYTWLMPKKMPEYADIRSYVLPYIGKTEDDIWFIIRWNYTGDDWVFFKEIKVLTDTTTWPVSVKYYDINRDTGYGTVFETWDQSVETNDVSEMLYLGIMYDIANSKSTTVRFKGDKYSYDLKVSDSDKKIIKDTVTYFIYLKNKQK